MRYRFNITINDEDYFAFNCFHSFERPQGKKHIRRLRLTFFITLALLTVLSVPRYGWSIHYIIIVILMAAVVTPVYFLLYSKKALRRNLRRQINRIKETGKLHYDPVSTMEFYEDKLVEFTDVSRTEKTYPAFERICVLSDRYLFLYHSSISAYILPIEQVKAQGDYQSFLAFLAEKCPTVEHY